MIDREHCTGCPAACNNDIQKLVSRLVLGENFFTSDCSGPIANAIVIEDSSGTSWEDIELACPKEGTTALLSET